MRIASGLIIVAFALAPVTARSQVFHGVKMAGVQVSTATPAIAPPPSSGLTFSPVAGHYTTTQSVTVTSSPSAGIAVFYTVDGSTPSMASTQFSSPISVSSNLTISALSELVGTVRQHVDRSSTGWKTVFATTPFPTGSCPNESVGGGVVAAIDTCTFDTTALGNTALHLAFSSSESGTGQRQVLWTMSGGKCNDCTEFTQSFDIMPAENPANVWAFENDMQLWDDTNGLELTAGLQCLMGSGSDVWEVSGQSGWVSSGVACSLPTTGFTHVEAHAHRVIGLLSCSYAGTPTECIYYDWLSINGVRTTLNKVFPAHPLPTGWSGGCYNQNQLDTTHSGSVGVYIKNKNMTCGYGTQATDSAGYTIP